MRDIEAEIRQLCAEIRARIVDHLEAGQRHEIPLAIDEPVKLLMRLSRECGYYHAPVERFPNEELFPDVIRDDEQWQCWSVDAVKPRIYFDTFPEEEWWRYASVVLAAWVRRLENGTMMPDCTVASPQGNKTSTVIDDSQKNSVPDNPDVRDLCLELREQWSGPDTEPTQIDIARKYTDGIEKQAKNLLRQCQRYKHIWHPDHR